MTMLSSSGIEEVSIATFFCLADNSKMQLTFAYYFFNPVTVVR